MSRRTLIAAVATAAALILAGPHAASSSAAAAVPGAASPASTRASFDVPLIPGTLFYSTDRGLNYARGRTVKLSGDGSWVAEASPDGKQIAFVDKTGHLKIRTLATGKIRTVRAGVRNFAFGPTWTPDGTRLIIGIKSRTKVDAAYIRLSDGHLTYLLPDIRNGWAQRVSGDGRQIFAVGDNCTIKHSRVDGAYFALMPRLGRTSKDNPTDERACDIVSINRNGTRIAVDLKSGDDTNGDSGDLAADTIIDVATGRPVELPVTGTVVAALYRPDGSLLVRTSTAGKHTLTVFSPTMKQLAAVTEPTWAKNLVLRDWTR